MYKHFDEPLFDYIIIRETGEFSAEGYKTARLFGVNYEDESKEILCGYIDCFKTSPSCQFDFHKNGGISVFCKDFSNQDCVSKVFAKRSYTGQIIAIKDCDKSLITNCGYQSTLFNQVAAKLVEEADSYSVQCTPNGLDNDFKNRGIQNQLYGLMLVPNNINYPIFTIYLYLWHATILILSAVEGLNGFKKTQYKRYWLFIVSVFSRC